MKNFAPLLVFVYYQVKLTIINVFEVSDITYTLDYKNKSALQNKSNLN